MTTTRFKRWLIVAVLLVLVFDTGLIRAVDARVQSRISRLAPGDPGHVMMPPETMMKLGLLSGPMGIVILR